VRSLGVLPAIAFFSAGKIQETGIKFWLEGIKRQAKCSLKTVDL
jgi:hypothetical protein